MGGLFGRCVTPNMYGTVIFIFAKFVLERQGSSGYEYFWNTENRGWMSSENSNVEWTMLNEDLTVKEAFIVWVCLTKDSLKKST